jgi:CheY-like chemotaxis protein
MMLKTLGCTVVVAKNGLEVLEKFKRDTFNIILMDIMMPEMDGITAMNKLKEKYRNLPPIIGLSAHAMEGDAEKFIEMGMDDYIEKPLKKETLLLKLKKWSCR